MMKMVCKYLHYAHLIWWFDGSRFIDNFSDYSTGPTYTNYFDPCFIAPYVLYFILTLHFLRV